MNKFCQSCGMPLEGHQGTETNITLSNDYCEMCYRDGQFTEPKITFNEMKARGITGLKQSNKNILVKQLIIWGYPSQLKNLARWK